MYCLVQFDLCAIAANEVDLYTVRGAVGLENGCAIALNAYAERFMRELNVVGLDGNRVEPTAGFEYLRALPYNLRGSVVWAQWNLEDIERGAEGELFGRLRREGSPHTVDRSLPVLFFGDYLTARAVTVALNPSNREFLSDDGVLLAGSRQRFATLDTYDRADRSELHDAECADAIAWMRSYFLPGRPWYRRYFGHLERFLEGAGYSYRAGTAAHVDLVQESTKELWNKLSPAEREALLTRDVPFLEWQLTARPLEAIFCNGLRVSSEIRSRFHVTDVQERQDGNFKWWTGSATVGGQSVPIAGWNYPLNRAAGFDRNRQRELGAAIGAALRLLV